MTSGCYTFICSVVLFTFKGVKPSDSLTMVTSTNCIFTPVPLSLSLSIAPTAEHSGSALPLRPASSPLHPLSLPGMELHQGPLLVLQVPRPVDTSQDQSPQTVRWLWGLMDNVFILECDWMGWCSFVYFVNNNLAVRYKLWFVFIFYFKHDLLKSLFIEEKEVMKSGEFVFQLD